MPQTVPTITIDLNKKCAECGSNKAGVAENGLCLQCTSKAVQGKRMLSAAGRAVAARFDDLKRRHSK